MKTILGFDSWTAGAHHFERLVPAFEEKGYRLLLIHIGSWGHDKDRPTEEMIGRLLVRDISFYKKKTVPEIFDIEKPCAVLFMSTRAFAHMAFNRYAQHRGIPTCHLYHGLVAVQAVGIDEKTYDTNYAQHFSMLINRSKKNLFLLLPFYAGSLYTTSAPIRVWLSLFGQILNKALGIRKIKNVFIPDTETTIGCVYTAADVEHMHRNYNIQLDKICVVGNPDLVQFGLGKVDIGFSLDRTNESTEIIYIDTALSESGLVFNSRGDFVLHLLATKDYFESIGLCLVAKLHPAHLSANTPDLLRDKGVGLCSDKDFVERLKAARAVIVEPSSAAIIPALIGLPILLCQYGKLSEQTYGKVLTSYPRSRYLRSFADVKKILHEEQQSLSIDSVHAWAEKNAGPMPPEEMPNRVAQAIDKIVQESERQCAV